MKSYFQFLAHQLKGWPQQSYYLFFFSFGCQVMALINNPIIWLSVITFIGTTPDVLCILSINTAKSVNGVLSILSTICFIIAGFSARNCLSIGKQTAHMITLDIPVSLSKEWNHNTASKIQRFTGKSWFTIIVSTFLVCLVSGFLIGRCTNDPRPWVDAAAFSISLAAGIISLLRYNNQYYQWLASELAQMVLWYISFTHGSASLAMFANSSVCLLNDVLAFTVSPWYNRKEHGRIQKMEEGYYNAQQRA